MNIILAFTLKKKMKINNTSLHREHFMQTKKKKKKKSNKNRGMLKQKTKMISYAFIRVVIVLLLSISLPLPIPPLLLLVLAEFELPPPTTHHCPRTLLPILWKNCLLKKNFWPRTRKYKNISFSVKRRTHEKTMVTKLCYE